MKQLKLELLDEMIECRRQVGCCLRYWMAMVVYSEQLLGDAAFTAGALEKQTRV